MERLNKKSVTIIIVTLILCTGIFLICNKNSDNATILDEVKLKDNEVSKKQFAMYIRESKNEEYHEYNENNLFPEGYKLDLDESGCVDSNGTKVEEEGTITQTADNKITLKSNKTVYCYLYFEKSGFNGTGSDLAKSETKGLIATPNKGDLAYRYVGTASAVDNYICFGTTVKNDCSNTNSNYLYRIIGIDTHGRLKLIKDTALNTSTRWHSGYSGSDNNAVWDTGNNKISAELYTNLNSSTFLNNNAYVPNSWKDKIDKTKWNIGDVNNNSYAQSGGNEIYTQEKRTQSTTSSEIGLMYLSDYYYSLDGQGTKNCRDNSSDYAKCKTSWLHITNNGLSQSFTEWTMTRYGWYGSNYYSAWVVFSSGQSFSYGIDDSGAVRPVFYLKPSVTIIEGEGSTENPFILSGN